jgi:hypothetical protein
MRGLTRGLKSGVVKTNRYDRLPMSAIQRLSVTTDRERHATFQLVIVSRHVQQTVPV